MKPWLGTGLLTSTGSKWLARRKIITPAFHFSILEDFVSIFDHHTSILVEKLRGHEGQGDVDIFPMTALCALDVIGGNLLLSSLFVYKLQERVFISLSFRKFNGHLIKCTEQN